MNIFYLTNYEDRYKQHEFRNYALKLNKNLKLTPGWYNYWSNINKTNKNEFNRISNHDILICQNHKLYDYVFLINIKKKDISYLALEKVKKIAREDINIKEMTFDQAKIYLKLKMVM